MKLIFSESMQMQKYSEANQRDVFSEMADFLETFHLDALGHLVSTSYSEGYGIQILRGFYVIIDEMDREEIQINECHDLHSIAMTSIAMEYFIDWVKEQNEFYFFFYNGLFH